MRERRMWKFIMLHVTMLLIVINIVQSQDVILKGMQQLRVTCKEKSQLELIKSYINNPGFEYLGTTKDQIDLFVTAEQIFTFKEFLKKNCIKCEILIFDVYKKAVEEFHNQRIHMEKNFPKRRMNRTTNLYDFSFYIDYHQILRYLTYIEKNFKNLVKQINIGTTSEGLPMYLLHISKSWGRNNSAIFIDAGIHAREWIAPAIALYMINQLVVNKTNNHLLTNVDVYILPVLNPDGYQYTHDKPENRFWRKTRSYTNDSSCFGVDANRNFDFQWNVTKTSTHPCSNTFPGHMPFSEPETRNLRNFFSSKKGSIKVYLSLHSAAQCLLYPWAYKTDLPSNEAILRQVGQNVAQAMYSVSKTVYKVGTPENALRNYQGPIGGTSLDWAMGVGGAELSYALELPAGEEDSFIFPIENILPVGQATLEGLKVLIKYVAPPSAPIIPIRELNYDHNDANDHIRSIKITTTTILVFNLILNRIIAQV